MKNLIALVYKIKTINSRCDRAVGAGGAIIVNNN